MSVYGPRPCPYCSKTKYKEPVALLQHILDAHPDDEIPKRLQSRYKFPCKCEHCNCSMASAIALLGHYASLHREAANKLYDFCFSNTAPPAGGGHVELISDRDIEGLTVAERCLDGETNVCLVPEQGQITIITGKGICRFSTAGIHATNIYNLLSVKDVIVYGSLASEDSIAQLLGKDPDTDLVSPYLFLSMDFITHVSVSTERDPYRKLQTYLISKEFFGHRPQRQCPMCDQEFDDMLGVYRCLFKKHTFPQYVMGQFKTDSHTKNDFVCSKCHISCGDYDGLIKHVYEQHKDILLSRVLKECDEKKDLDYAIATKLRSFIEREINSPGADDSAPVSQTGQPAPNPQQPPGYVADAVVPQGYIPEAVLPQGCVYGPPLPQGYVYDPSVPPGFSQMDQNGVIHVAPGTVVMAAPVPQ